MQALVERDGRLLLGRRAFEPSVGLWDLPGGFLEENEHPLDALVRELREETGLEIEPQGFVGVWMEPYQDRIVLCLTWDARVTGGTERAADDVSELAGSRRTSCRGTTSSRSGTSRNYSGSGARGTSTRSPSGSIRKRTGASSSTGSPSTAIRNRGCGAPITSSVHARSSQVMRRKPCGM